VDWLHATFPAPDDMTPEGFIAYLSRVFRRPISAEQTSGLFGFKEGARLIGHYGSRKAAMGSLSWGGEGQGGRWFLQLTGVGCSMLQDWLGLRALLEALDAKLTRLDLAVDFLNGEHCVEEALTLYEMGGFTTRGRNPSSALAGDWLGGIDGRTLYVGKAANGKMLRVYEKGRQLGDATSEWVRFEVQLGNRDRVIPFDALTERDAFFAGCYPVLASMVEEAAQFIPTKRAEGEVTLGHLMRHAVRSYGKLFDVVSDIVGVSNADFVQEVRVIGLPRRVNPSSLAAGLTWEQLLSQMRGQS
jgi:phage replication initiation protein